MHMRGRVESPSKAACMSSRQYFKSRPREVCNGRGELGGLERREGVGNEVARQPGSYAMFYAALLSKSRLWATASFVRSEGLRLGMDPCCPR